MTREYKNFPEENNELNFPYTRNVFNAKWSFSMYVCMYTAYVISTFTPFFGPLLLTKIPIKPSYPDRPFVNNVSQETFIDFF